MYLLQVSFLVAAAWEDIHHLPRLQAVSLPPVQASMSVRQPDRDLMNLVAQTYLLHVHLCYYACMGVHSM